MLDNGDFTKDRFGFSGGWLDAFTSLTSLSVTNADVQQTIKLERTTGILNLIITDAIPANTAKITISVQPESSYKYVSGAPETSIIGTSYNTSIFSGDIGVRNKTLTATVGNTGAAVNINVKAYNSGNVVTAEKNIPNVTLVKNKKTQVSVQLFTP